MRLHQFFLWNEVGRDFVMGDLHGMYDLFQEKLVEIKFDKEKDRMFSLGDLIDRGPDSLKCLQLIAEPWFFSVRGNHEDMMVHAVLKRSPSDMELWEMNGGKWGMSVKYSLINRWAQKVDEQLPVSLTIGYGPRRIGIVHAEPNFDWELNITPKIFGVNNSMWGRSIITHKVVQSVENVGATYSGHTPTDTVVRLGNKNFIDTGAVFDGELTILEITHDSDT